MADEKDGRLQQIAAANNSIDKWKIRSGDAIHVFNRRSKVWTSIILFSIDYKCLRNERRKEDVNDVNKCDKESNTVRPVSNINVC